MGSTGSGQKKRRVEWPTVILIGACYGAWFALAFAGDAIHPALWILATGVATTLHWSLVHEAVHGHPTPSRLVNHALVWLPLGWVYPFGRFEDAHLEHHATGALSDPFDDPESWYLDPADWARRSRLARAVLRFNNTLFGRMLIGPIITIWRMTVGDAVLAWRNATKRSALGRAWLGHLIAATVLGLLVFMFSSVPPWQFAAAAYLGMSILLIRTFLEHQAAEDEGERTVIIEDRGPLAFLFLFNNLHVVHHLRPGLAWYRLPGFYRRHRERFIQRNNGYCYPHYGSLFARYFLKPKEPVPHPLPR